MQLTRVLSVSERPLAVFVAWKDIRHPAAGGAEIVHQEWSKRLIQDGYRVVHLVPGFADCLETETVDGVEIRRFGKSVLSFYAAARHYRREFASKTDLLIDVFNCFGSFALRAGCRGKSVFMIHHIQDRMWFYQTTFPGVPRALMPVINVSGYVLEKIQLRLLAHVHPGAAVVTVSPSSADELALYGFRRDAITIAHNGNSIEPLASLDMALPKYDEFTVLLLGPRKSKRPMETLKAFAAFQAKVPEAALMVAGWGTEFPRMKAYAQRNGICNVTFEGRVSEERKRELLQRCHVLCTTPVKEGWGLIVNEANTMGTPVIGYDVPGLRDALAFGNGELCVPNPESMAEKLEQMHKLWKDSPESYRAMCERALEASRQWSFDRSYREFRAALK